MANSFSITIRAVDQATATVRKINNEVSKSVRPVTMLGKSVKSLGNELGLGKMAASIGKVAKGARGAAGEIAKIGAPVLALVGGGSLIGIMALADAWGRLGFEVARTSETLGVSAGTLQSLRGAAEMAGVSSSDLTGGLKSLGDTMEDALYGRNQQALAVLNKLGISIRKTSTGAIDSERGFRDLADAISKIKSPQVQGLVARQFGVEALLPLLRKGSAAIDAYQKKAREMGVVQTPEQIKRAEEFGQSLIMLKMAGQGLRNTIGDALVPAFQPLIEQLTKWMTLNRQAIGEKVGQWAQQFADWVKSIDFDKLFKNIKDIVGDIASFVNAIGGWKTAAVAVGVVMAGPLLLAITQVGAGLVGLAMTTIPLVIGGLITLGSKVGQVEGGAASLAKTAGKVSTEVITVGSSAGKAAADVATMEASMVSATSKAALLARGIGALGGLASAGSAGYAVGEGINWLLDKAGISVGASAYNNTHIDSMSPKQTGTARDVVSFFEKQGWSHAQALGIAANLKAESGFNTDVVGDNGSAYGIAQWHAKRQQMFKHWAHKDIRESTLQDQLGFVNYELTQGSEKHAGEELRKTGDERQAAAVVSRLYERPAAVEKEQVARADIASGIARQVGVAPQVAAAAPGAPGAPGAPAAPGVPGAPGAPGAAGAPAPAPREVAQAEAPTEMKHTFELTLHGIPPGIRATARKADGTHVPVNIATSMPGVSP